MKDIEPDPKLNKIVAGLIGIVALYFLFLAYDTYTLVESSLDPDPRFERMDWIFTWSIVGGLAGIGSLLILFALLLWRSPPINSARLRFRSGGFRLETKQLFRGRKAFDLDWADIKTVVLHNGGLFGGRHIKVAQGSSEKIARFAPAWTDCSSQEVIERLQASAEASGHTFEKVAGGWFSLGQDHWKVTQKI